MDVDSSPAAINITLVSELRYDGAIIPLVKGQRLSSFVYTLEGATQL